MYLQFNRHFELLIAETPALVSVAQRIRYQVYCQELGFERAEDHPDGLERDSFDAHAIHCLVQQREDKAFVGCVRLILCRPDRPEEKLPFEHACQFGLTAESQQLLQRLPRHRFGEVSRLAVPQPVRCGAAVKSNRDYGLVAVGLYLAATAVSLEVSLDRVMTMMEPRLARHLRRFGMHFEQLGDVVDYHGKRGPFSITRTAVLDGLQGEMRELLRQTRQKFRPVLAEHAMFTGRQLLAMR